MSDVPNTPVESKPKFKIKEKCGICGISFIPLEFETHSTNCNYYDSIMLQKRKEKYQRNKTIKKMVKKHALGNCNCKKTEKYCSYEHNELYPILYKVKEAYLSSDIEGNILVEGNIDFFETMYNTNMSIKNSNSYCAGKAWEDSFEEILENAGFRKNIHYATQVYLSNDGTFKEKQDKGKNTGHTIDFMIPPPIWGTRKEDFLKEKGLFISCKTTTRERVHQDKFLGKFVLLTTQDYETDDPNITVITPKNDGNQLTIFIKKLLTEYPLL